MVVCCPVCNSSATAFFLSKNSWQLLRCRKCGFVFVAPEHDGNGNYQGQYLEDKTSPTKYYESIRRYDLITFRRRLALLQRFAPGRTILDIGTNIGTFLLAARESGWQATGVEPNPRAAWIGREKGLSIIQSFFDDYFVDSLADRGQLFDAIHMGDVIEHIPQPLPFIRLAVRLLGPSGVVMAVTPDIETYFARRFQIKPEEHKDYFNRHSLRLAFEKCGLEVAYCARSSRWRDLGNMHQSTTQLGKIEKTVMRAARLKPVGRILSWLLSVIIRDEITIIGRKI